MIFQANILGVGCNKTYRGMFLKHYGSSDLCICTLYFSTLVTCVFGNSSIPRVLKMTGQGNKLGPPPL